MQKNDRDSLDLAIEGLEAQLEALTGASNTALEKLAGKTDPESSKRRISILIDQNRLDDAAAEVRSLPKSPIWIDLGIFVLAATGDLKEAKEYLDWSKLNVKRSLYQRSGIRFYDGTIRWIFRGHDQEIGIIPGSLTSDETKNILTAKNVLNDLCASALAQGKPDGELEVELITRFLDAAYIIGNLDECTSIARVLENSAPISIRVGYAVLQQLTPPANVAERLWSEHKLSFDHRHLACAIWGMSNEDRKKTLNHVYQLKEIAISELEKQKMAELLYSLAEPSDAEEYKNILDSIDNLLGENSTLSRFILAETHIAQGDIQAGLSIIESIEMKSDPQALRIRAMAELALGNSIKALELFQEFSKKSPSSWIYGQIADLAAEQNLADVECEALKHLIALRPNENRARKRLAFLYGRKKDYRNAAFHFEILFTKIPDDIDVISNLAVTYMLDGQHLRALNILENVTGILSEDFRLTVTRSQVLQLLGRVGEAFDVLAALKNLYWENPEYLVAFMTAGHLADKEKESHEALQRLIELKHQGLVDNRLLHEASLDDVRELLSGAAKRNEKVHRHIIEGKFPWLLGAEIGREAYYWAWTLRTQKVEWLADDAISRSSYCIYSTNSFRVLHSDKEGVILTDIQPSAPGQKVVADASALITIHELGLLEKASKYFSKVCIPASYLPKVIDDLKNLFPHQLSKKLTSETIKSAIDQKYIHIFDGEEAIIIDEYSEENTNTPNYHIRDIIDALYENGCISDSDKTLACAIAHQPPASEKLSPPLKLGDFLLIAESTLMTLAGINWIDKITRYFTIYLTRHDYEEISSRIRAFGALEDTRQKHSSLWEYIQNNQSHFEFLAETKSLTIDEEEEGDHDNHATSAFKLATENTLPLFVDDRVCQALLLNDRKSDAAAAFGSDALLLGMLEHEYIDSECAAVAYLKLIEWRYKFIHIPPEILKHLAARYKNHPPGVDLLRVAAYIHDCMRDEGLFAGIEPTDIPTSIAMRLYQTWAQNIADFIMDVWLDETFDKEMAAQLTDWAMLEFLPSPPISLDERTQSVVASLTSRTVITRALLRSTKSIQNVERANEGLRRMAKALDVKDSEYMKIVAGVLDAI